MRVCSTVIRVPRNQRFGARLINKYARPSGHAYHSHALSSRASYLLLDVRSFGVGDDGNIWCRADASIELGIPVDIPVWRRGQSVKQTGHSDGIMMVIIVCR